MNTTNFKESECVVCSEEESTIIFNPCKHICCCITCALRVLKCPMCRAVVITRFFESGQELSKLSNWKKICKEEKLSETFIGWCTYLVDWNHVSSCQKLSEEFIEKYHNKVNWTGISYNKKIELSSKFMQKHIRKLDIAGLRFSKKEMDDEFKKLYIKIYKKKLD